MPEKIDSTNLPLIRTGRTKKDPTKAIGEIPGDPESHQDTIKLTMVASPADWDNLYILGVTDPERLGRAIFLNFAEPVKDIPRKSGAREPVSAFMREARQYVAAVYVVASHYAKAPYEVWPEDFKRFVESLNLDSIKYMRRSVEGQHSGRFSRPAAWADFGFEVRPGWWGHASLIEIAGYRYELVSLSYQEILLSAKKDGCEIRNPRTGLLVASRIAHWAWKSKFDRKRKELKLDDKKDRLDFKETYLDGNQYLRHAKIIFTNRREVRTNSEKPYKSTAALKGGITLRGAPQDDYEIVKTKGGFIGREFAPPITKIIGYLKDLP